MAVSGPLQLAVRLIGTEPIRQTDIIKNQSFALTCPNLDMGVEFEFIDTYLSPRKNYD